MSLKDLFDNKNPFGNLTVAGPEAVRFPLRGHEDQLDDKKQEILDAIDSPDYPATAQHTIVFGEWGHGKSHVLRTLADVINSQRPKVARALFFEPTDSSPEDIFADLCEKLDITASNSSEFIIAIKAKYPENFFLLIDETQSIAGEELSKDMESNLNEYWKFLGGLQSEASKHLYGLHVFHGLSANSAGAISRIGQVPTIREFEKYIFTLGSLTEETQWEMLCDHLKHGADDQDLQAEQILDRGVNRCVYELTGGNPRWSLVLMEKIFDTAMKQEVERIDGATCYQTLQGTPRFDASDNNYFDKFRTNQILNELSEGKTTEQKIGQLLQQKISTILGEWKGVEQSELDSFDLNTATIRTRCDSLRKPMVIFEQPPGGDDFSLRHEFLNAIGVIRQSNLSDSEDKELLLSLQLEPESLISVMMIGLRKVMIFNSHPGEFISPDAGKYLNRLYKTESEGVHIALNVFKGKEIPIELYGSIIKLLDQEDFSVVFLVEDASTTSHDLPGSTWDKFKESYTGPIDPERRFVFINGTDQDGKRFDEDFFVLLAAPNNIQEEEAKSWYERLQIRTHLDRVKEECLYCPEQNEQVLIDELAKQKRSFNIGELKDLQDTYDWVSRARLGKLKLYIDKKGNSYQIHNVDLISPVKFILRELQQSDGGLEEAEIDTRLAARFIRTGNLQSIESHTHWLLSLLKSQSKVKSEGEVFRYKDLDRELQLLKGRYKSITNDIEKDISNYELAGIDITKLGQLKENISVIADQINEGFFDFGEPMVLAYESWNKQLEDIQTELNKVPVLVREQLAGQLEELQNLYSKVSEKSIWPYQEDNPYKSEYGLNDIEKDIAELKTKIEENIPKQRECRKQITDNKKRLNALNALLGGTLSPGSYEGAEDVGQCIFNVINAVRDEASGDVTVHFSKALPPRDKRT